MRDGSNRFGRYELVDHLALGGMAELFRAIIKGPSGFEKTVAIKKLLPKISRDANFRKMFLHEGQIMAALSHRNLVQILDLGEESGELYMCLEFVDGCNLAEVQEFYQKRKQLINPYLAAWIAREICQGLQYVHNLTDTNGDHLHVVHRDVNPQNILLSFQGDVKLGDFGIAKSLVAKDRTAQGKVKGKLRYLAPEQAGGDRVSPATDLYAVGVVLYELLSGSDYNKGKNDIEMMQHALKPTWRSITEGAPNLPRGLENVVRRALRVEQENRFVSATAFIKALSKILDSATCIPTMQDISNLVNQVCGVGPKNAVKARPIPDCQRTDEITAPPVKISSTPKVKITRRKKSRTKILLGPEAASKTAILPEGTEYEKRILRYKILRIVLVVVVVVGLVLGFFFLFSGSDTAVDSGDELHPSVNADSDAETELTSDEDELKPRSKKPRVPKARRRKRLRPPKRRNVPSRQTNQKTKSR